jgi:3-oxoacyl-[acyl-carrier protein] reductase
MQPDLHNQVALVTGASRGIGKSIAFGLAGAGASVVLTARNNTDLLSVRRKISSRGGTALHVPADLSREKDILRVFQEIRGAFGRLDILVNNAGIGLWGKLIDFPLESFDRIMEVNVRGLYICCQQAMKIMTAQRSGFIFNISSVVGFKGYPGQSAYTASKHAVMGVTKSLAVEAQEHNICVTAILPGGVNTEFIGDARPDLDRSILIPPEDIARCVLFLLSLSDRSMIDEIYIRRRNSEPFK